MLEVRTMYFHTETPEYRNHIEKNKIILNCGAQQYYSANYKRETKNVIK